MATSAEITSVKDYIFTEKLGSGTYAVVYKAYRKGRTRDVVAIKCVQKSSLNKVSSENLLTEIELLKTLKHENIVQLKDFQWDEKHIYLIMEYCSGGDLNHFIHARRTLSEISAKRLMQQLASALQYMRSMHISHMDLKPQNILLSSATAPVLKVADFGFAHYLLGDTDAVHLRGSPLYMAPEIITKRHYNEKADLWSLGVILFECLFGKAPFHSKSFEELEEKIIDTKPVEMPYGVEVSNECHDLLQGLLQRDPDTRMSFDDFFAHPFIDLQHRPSSSSFDSAVSLVKHAIEHDNQQNYQKAIQLYCQALEYFVPAIHYESDPGKKEALRKKVREYMFRAEELKQALKPSLPPASFPRRGQGSLSPGIGPNKPRYTPPTVSYKAADDTASIGDEASQLGDLWRENVPFQAALKVVQSAEQEEREEDFEGALHKYEIALEALLKILQDEPKGRRRDLLQKEVFRWMNQAEAVKNYLCIKDLKTHDTSTQEEEENNYFLSQCVLQ